MARMSWTALLCMGPQVWNAWNNCAIKAKEDTLSKIFSYNRGLLCKYSSDWLTKVLLIRGLNSSKLFTVLQEYLYFMCFSIDLHIEGINLPFLSVSCFCMLFNPWQQTRLWAVNIALQYLLRRHWSFIFLFISRWKLLFPLCLLLSQLVLRLESN